VLARDSVLEEAPALTVRAHLMSLSRYLASLEHSNSSPSSLLRLTTICNSLREQVTLSTICPYEPSVKKGVCALSELSYFEKRLPFANEMYLVDKISGVDASDW
jgi:hypothetical protein